MGYRRFEELPVWQDAIELAAQIFQLTSSGEIRTVSGLKDQIERAVVSISNNIAEGFERGTNQELISFLYTARGSAGEVRSMLCLLERVAPRQGGCPELPRLRVQAEGIGRQLGRWIESLKNSGFQGTRSQNERTRDANDASRRRAAFLEELQRIQVNRTHPISGRDPTPHDSCPEP